MSLYEEVQSTIKDMIEGIDYGPGDRIPSERQLAAELDVSRMTVRRAIDNLVQLGMLQRRSTSGTYVRNPEVVRRVRDDSVLGLSQLLRRRGASPGSRLLSFDVKPAPRKVAISLDIQVGAPVVLIHRLRLSNDKPFCIETAYLPRSLVPGLAADDLAGDVSLYELLRTRYDILPAKSDRLINVSYATPEEAELLGIQDGSPVLFMSSVMVDTLGRRVEYMKGINHPERVSFRSGVDLG